MSHAMDDHEMVLRSVLRAAAEQLEPAVDGLERIKAQLGPPLPVPLAWVLAMWTRLCLRAPDGLWTVTDRIAREFRLVSERFMPAAGGHGSGSGHDRLSWVRPAAAMSIVVFIVTAVVYMAIEVPQAISPSGNFNNQVPGAHASSRGSGNGSRDTQTGPGVGPYGSTGSGKPGSSPACSATPRATTPPPVISVPTTPPASSSPSQTASPTATATPTPTSSSATPTPSASSSSSPGAGTGTAAASGASSSPLPGPAASTAPDAGPTTGGIVMKTPAQSGTMASPTATACGSPRPAKKGKTPTASPAAAALLLPTLTTTEARARTYY